MNGCLTDNIITSKRIIAIKQRRRNEPNLLPAAFSFSNDFEAAGGSLGSRISCCIREIAPGEDVGDSIERNIAANDFASVCDDDETLSEAVLAISPALRLEQHFLRDGGTWDNGMSVLQLDGPLPMTCEVDLPVLAFLNQMYGVRTVSENIARFEEHSGAGTGALVAQLLPAVRLFVRNGFLEAADS